MMGRRLCIYRFKSLKYVNFRLVWVSVVVSVMPLWLNFHLNLSLTIHYCWLLQCNLLPVYWMSFKISIETRISIPLWIESTICLPRIETLNLNWFWCPNVFISTRAIKHNISSKMTFFYEERDKQKLFKL